MDELLTTGDAAKRLDRSTDRVRQYEREGKLSAQKTRSGQRLFQAADVERLAKELRNRKWPKKLQDLLHIGGSLSTVLKEVFPRTGARHE